MNHSGGRELLAILRGSRYLDPIKHRLSLILGVILAALLAAPSLASAWAPASSAPVHPGVQTFTEGAQCTSNFVFKERKRLKVAKRKQGLRKFRIYIGQAAHCSGTGFADETDGCESESLPLGTEVEVDGAKRKGKLVYNSWLAMQETGEEDPDACAYNDFALVKLRRADVDRVNPSVPVFGGPRGVGAAEAGEEIFTYGNSGFAGPATEERAKEGFVVDRFADGWSYDTYTVPPGVPGDSGSGFLNSAGEAFGVLSTLAIAPLPASNGVSDLGFAIDYARAHGMSKLRLVAGTEPFQP